MDIKNKELHRVVTTALIYKPASPAGRPEYLTDLTFIRSNGTPVLCLSYFTPYVSGEVELNDEATEFAWITADQVGNYDFVDGISEEIKQIDEILNKRK